MRGIWEAIKSGAVRLIDPVADLFVRWGVSPNSLTTIGAAFHVSAALAFGFGQIRTAGWILSLTALFDVLDGTVARKAKKETVFGAFYDSTLDRVADGALMAGLAVFYATSVVYGSTKLMIVSLVGMIGTFLISYTRARAEALRLDAKVGFLQRPERLVLLSAPQALFGLAFGGRVLAAIVILLTLTAWITAIQRILYVARVTSPEEAPQIRVVVDAAAGNVNAPSRQART